MYSYLTHRSRTRGRIHPYMSTYVYKDVSVEEISQRDRLKATVQKLWTLPAIS